MLIAAAAFIFLCVGANSRPLQYDELYHILAARSWAEGHDLSIAEGHYGRARLYTLVTGLTVEAFGVSPLASRLPAIAAGALLVAALFSWVASIAGRRAGLVAAFLFCCSYPTVENAQFARFYTLHALAIWICAVTGYTLLTRWGSLSPWQRAGRSMIALLAFATALHLQSTTAIAALTLAAALSSRADWSQPAPHVRQGSGRWIAAAGLGVLVVLIVLGWGRLGDAYRLYGSGAAWAAEVADRPSYYYGVFDRTLGWIFSLFPAAVLMAWSRRPPAVTFCAVFVVCTLLAHSFAAMKAERYVFYVLPFLFAIWGIAIDSGWRRLAGLLQRKQLAVAPRWKLAAAVALVMTIPLGLLGVPAYRATASSLLSFATGGKASLVAVDPRDENVDWTPDLPLLHRLAETEMFVTADDLRALHYLGGYDLLLNLTVLRDYSESEFARDPRTGGHGFSSVAALRQVVRCYDRGTILVSNRRWRSADVTDDAANFIERHMTRVALPARLRMRAYVWRSVDAPLSNSCRALRGRIGDQARRDGGRLVNLVPPKPRSRPRGGG